jgi:hypothetical protein
VTVTTLHDIRRQLREKFPAAHGSVAVREPVAEVSARPFAISTFPLGAISELIPGSEGSGLALWLAGLLAEPADAPPFPAFVLVDGGDTFDPASYTATACSQLLWVRCSRVMEVLKAADLLVRDGNIPFIMLDLSGLPLASLKSVPAAAWWRLKQLCETTACRLVVLTRVPVVPCASLRLELSARLTLHDFDLPRSEILSRMVARPNRLRHAT